MRITTRAPVRVDFAGGWTDVALFTEDTKGLVANAAINIYSYATIVTQTPRNESVSGELKRVLDKSVRIYSADFDSYVEADDIKQLEYDGNIDLVKAAINRMAIEEGGFNLITQSNAPPGSGLGTSAAMGVALVGALGRFKGVTLLPYEYAEFASDIEKHELGILGGKQDHYASAVGGVNFMEFMGESVKTSPLHLAPDVLYELEKNLVLCYTGQSRLSGNIHQNVTDAYRAGEKRTHDALRNLKTIAEAVKTALLNSRLDDFAQLLNDNWENQKALHPSVTNPQIDHLFALALNNGAIGGKACGAGGGGCLLFYCYPDKEYHVRRKLVEAGATVIHFNFDFDGLRMWQAE